MGILPDYLFDPNAIAGRGDLVGGGDSFADRWAPLQQSVRPGSAPAAAAFDASAWPLSRLALMPPFPAMPGAPAASPGATAAPAPNQAGNAAVAAPSGGTMPSALNSLPFPAWPSLFPHGSPGIGDRLDAGLLGFANSNGPVRAIANMIHGLATGERSDRQGVAQRQQDQAQAATFQALRAAGLPEQHARAGALDPAALRTILTALYARSPASGAGQPQQQPPQQSQVQPPPAPPLPGARMAPDGSWYVRDPARPGRYLKVP